jgi:diguanylate cyclase (GGDEF)-like protein
MSLEREHAAGHDALTGLLNRVTLGYEIDQALLIHQREGTRFGLLLIDLDDFKTVNDTLGHQVGDDLLTTIAERLRHNVRPGDVVARLGGDEFAVLVFDADVDEVRIVAERMRAGVGSVIMVEGINLEVQMSLGIAVCPDDGLDTAALLRHADVAMYRAKHGRTGIEAYSPEHDDNNAARLGLISELRRALDDDELTLHYQPQQAHDGSLMGVEALVRWPHPQRGLIPPDQFIPLAERSGIMPALTARVIHLALDEIARWRAQGIELPVAVNISPTDLIGDDLPGLVARELAAHSVPAASLRLEITEQVMSHDVQRATSTLDRLRASGVTISLDDFGTGYSSLLRLSSMPVDEIKLDRVFVSRLSEGPRAIGIVRTLIGLAHALGVPAIAEGVETEAQLRLLEEMGCDGVQGWHIARPMAADAFVEWLRTRSTAPTATSTPAPPAVEVVRRAPRRQPAPRAHRQTAPAEGSFLA